MLKRFILALATIAGLATPAYSAGLVPLSLQYVATNTGAAAAGCKLYTFQAATTTPQTVYQDSALTIPWPNPVLCDASARLPQIFAADGNIKLRLTTSGGTELLAVDSVLVIGPSSGGGGGGSVDATTILATGDLKVRYGTGALSGFVRANGRTIGSATSGGTERANADTQTLFEYLWNNDSNLSVSGGRGASAAADWAANKTIALPDWRGRLIAGLDDMGNTAASRLTSTYFGTSAIVLGAAGGAQSFTLTTSELPAHTHSITDPGHTHGFSGSYVVGTATTNVSPAGGTIVPTGTTNPAIASAVTGISATNSTGSGAAFTKITPTMLATIYIKLKRLPPDRRRRPTRGARRVRRQRQLRMAA